MQSFVSCRLVAAQLLVKTKSALQRSECCSATSAAQLSETCSQHFGTDIPCRQPRKKLRAEKYQADFPFPIFYLKTCTPVKSGTEKQPKHKVFGRDIPGTSGTQTSGYPGQKLYASGCFCCFRQGMAGTSQSQRTQRQKQIVISSEIENFERE